MSAAVMMERIAEWSPGFKARIAGGLNLLSLVTAALTELFVRGRLNYAGGYIAILGMVAVTLLLYGIFKPVNRGIALLAAFFSLVGLVVEALRWQPQGVNVAVVFNGISCLLTGYLIFRSIFLPRILGALMAFAGLAWLTFLSNPLVNYLSPYNLATGVLGQALVMLWLLVMGVNDQRWKEQARAA
ncbi:MAG TPA: DUF4386 family protein [Terracidiphilus sp.]|nr:DUF4386 family protein [Terracidiphilus sp.]